MILSILWGIAAIICVSADEWTATALFAVGAGFYGRWTR